MFVGAKIYPIYVDDIYISRLKAAFGFLFFGFRAFYFPVFGEGDGPFFCSLDYFISLAAEFATYIYIAILGSVYLEIEMAGIGCFVSLHARELYIFSLVVVSESG
jgi:hypothetical protein